MITAFLIFLSILLLERGQHLQLLCLICFIIGPYIINILKKKQKKGQPIRLDGPEWQITAKKGTPTMGGTMIIAFINNSHFIMD